jgi:small-conductance mechanosensitive channel
MDWQAELERIATWSADMSGPYQRAMWAAIAVGLSLAAGWIVARLVSALARRLSGLTQRKRKHESAANAPPGDADGGADHAIIAIVAVLIRALFLAGGVAVAGDILGLYRIDQAESLAIATAKGVAILVAVWLLGSWISRRVRRFGDTVDRGHGAGGRTLFAFLSSLVKFGALAVGAIAALQQFGFPIASLVAVVGAAGLAIALALQDTLKAVAAGVIIAIFRPYRIGDYVRVSGEHGTVTDITPFTTVLDTVDNRRITVTNDKAWGATIENFTANRLRRIDEVVGVSYDDDLDAAMEIIRTVVSSDPRARRDPPVWVKVDRLNTHSVDLRFRVWCASPDFFDFRCDLLKAVKEAFDAGGVTIPYPHQVQVEAGRREPAEARPS